MLPEQIKDMIRFQVGEIDSEFQAFKPLFDLIRLRKPDLVEMTALASVLHSFYNGVENIFIIIARKVDETIPSGQKWHSDLLIQMTHENEKRKGVISHQTFEILKEYLMFRHFIRHSYKWRINWDEFKNIALDAEATWYKVKTEFSNFTGD